MDEITENHGANATAHFTGHNNHGFQLGSNHGNIRDVYIGSSHRPEVPRSSPEPFSTTPFKPNPDFIERGDVLKQIRERCSQPSARLALVGLGGVGKSHLAIQYSHQLRKESPHTYVFWIHAGSKARFEEGYKVIAEQLGLIEPDDLEANVLQLLKNWLRDERNGQWLMIVDNADDAATFYTQFESETTGQVDRQSTASTSLASCLPQSSNGSILFTSRSKDVAAKLAGGRKNLIEIGPMTETEGLSLLQSKLKSASGERDDTSDLPLLKALDFIPLAVTQAAAYIDRLSPRCSVSTYLRRFHENETSRNTLLKTDTGDLWRDENAYNSIFATWQISFEQIKEERPSASDLLSLMSFFNRQGIPDFVLRDYQGSKVTEISSEGQRTPNAGLRFRKILFIRQRFSDFVHRSRRKPKPLQTTDSDDQTQTKESDDQEFEEDLAVLRSYCLITNEKDGNTFGMHRLVQMSTRMWLNMHNQFHEWNSTFLAVMAAKMTNESEPADWPRCEALFPHAEAAEAEHVVPGSLRDWSNIVLNAAYFANQMGKYDVAERMARKVMDVNEKFSGWEDGGTLSAADAVNSFLLPQGKYKEAEKMSERVLRARERFHNEDHIDALSSINNLAQAYLWLGRYERAEEMYLRAIKYSERSYGSDHVDTVFSMNGLGLVYIEQSRWEAAEEMLQRVVDAYEKLYGKEHHCTLTGMGNLATVCNEQGKHETAEEMHQRVLEGREKLLGDGHPDTLSSISLLGIVYLKQGKYQRAEEMQRRALEGREKALGREHPDTLWSMSGLGVLYVKLGRYQEAEEMQRLALQGREKTFGREHLDTINSVYRLAQVLKRRGAHGPALELFQRAYTGYRKAFGDDDYQTIDSEQQYQKLLQLTGNISP